MRRGPQEHGIYGKGEGVVIRVEARQTKTLARSNCLRSAGRRGVVEVKRRAPYRNKATIHAPRLRAPSTVVGAEQWSAPSSDSQRTRSEVIEACAVDANQRSQQPSSPVAAAA